MRPILTDTDVLRFPAGDGEMAALVRDKDWTGTPLGAIEGWSTSLRMAVRSLLINRFPLLLWWGPEFISIYNDACRPVLGAKHPQALGRPARECWAEVWETLQPLIDTPFQGGPATWMDDIELAINRHGFIEETHFAIAYRPVPDDTAPNRIGGVLASVQETTEQVIRQRRMTALHDLAACTMEAESAEQACEAAATALENHAKDVPFALFYLIDTAGQYVHLAGAAGARVDQPATPAIIELDPASASASPWPFAQVQRDETAVTIDHLGARFEKIPSGPWLDPPHTARVVPIPSRTAHQLAGFMVAGISPRLHFDAHYRDFLALAATQVATAIARSHADEDDSRRVDVMAELDRAKTAFFSSVSHELRTPLTLLLGPLEEALASADLPQARREGLDLAYRNAQRLLKLANTLLDFSSIEAGRAKARYEATDLAALTVDLASNFRSACESAGLSLVIDCAPLPEPVYVDRDMWEKIVLNLLSNAVKFTFTGGITVRLRARESAAQLTLRDTGEGIARDELPRLFERYHRIEGQRSRSSEGSGIGLSLVQELVKLNRGTIRAESTLGEGSTFTVEIPFGTAHLPNASIEAADEADLDTRASSRANAYAEEALHWLPDTQGTTTAPQTDPAPEATSGTAEARVLVVDDNADMRAYVHRLLEPLCTVETVDDGAAALEAIRARRPQLVLADVMMPGLDGFGLLRALRADVQFHDLPVMLLSARATEEERVEGLEAGAADYLVKPFSARELVVRVEGNLKLAQGRQDAMQTLRESDSRKTFLLRLSDSLRAQPDADAVASLAVRLLAEQLQADRCYVASIYPDEDRADITHQFSQPDASPLPKSIRPSDFPTALQPIFTQTTVFPDTAAQPDLTEADRQSLAALGFGALVVGVVRHDEHHPVWSMVVVSKEPRHWTASEITLVEEAAERTRNEITLLEGASERASVAVEPAHTEKPLAEGDEEYRTLFDSIDEGFCIIEMLYDEAGKPVDYRFLEVNSAFYRHTGLANATGRTVKEMVPEQEQHWFDIYGEVAATGRPKRFEQRGEGMHRWFSAYAFRVGLPRQRRVAVIFTDISERKRAEHHRDMLIHELNHRVKNTLATVQSLASQSLRNADNMEDARERFDARLLTLAGAHDVLTREQWQGAGLDEIVRNALAPFDDAGQPQRLQCDGPPLSLQPRAAVAIAMALHELATNAVKYGALSNRQGRVECTWSVARRDEPPSLHLEWSEHDGPPVRPPDRRGFGSRLIERGLAHDLGGTVYMHFAPEGVKCSIDAPLTEIESRQNDTDTRITGPEW